MQLRHPWIVPIVALIFLALVVVALLVQAKKRHYVPAVRTERLTKLPGYKRTLRNLIIYDAVVIITAVFLVFIESFIVARPYRVHEEQEESMRVDQDEVMICTDKSLTDFSLAAVLRYFVQPAHSDSNLIGLTSQTTRYLPLSDQHWYTSEELHFLSTIARQNHKAKKNDKYFSVPSLLARQGMQRDILYTDYKSNYVDTLASCAQGFTNINPDNLHNRRSILYVGSTVLPEKSNHIYSESQLISLAHQKKVSINYVGVIDKGETEPKSSQMSRLVKATAGISRESRLQGASHLSSEQKRAQLDTLWSKELNQIYGSLTSQPHRVISTYQRQIDHPQILLSVSVMLCVIFSLLLIRKKL